MASDELESCRDQQQVVYQEAQHSRLQTSQEQLLLGVAGPP